LPWNDAVVIIFTFIKNLALVFKNLKWPSFYQWSQFFKILSKKERNFIFLFLCLFFAALVSIGFRLYQQNTEIVPALGGSYSEGIVGSPRYLNPLLLADNDTDWDLAKIIFSGLFKYDNQGNLIPDLAESYQIQDDGKTYVVYLKKNAFWHDGKQVTAEDVIFTMQIIQNQYYRSPLRLNWIGINIEKIDDFSVRFILKNTYALFPYNLTFGLIPKHLWQNVSATDFALNEGNLNPVGSGPYVFKKLEKNKDGSIKSVQLQASKKYYLKGPFISQLIFKFYADEQKALEALRKSEIQGIGYLSPQNYADLKNNPKNAVDIFQLKLPWYFSLFINQAENKALADKNVRLALAHGIDKNKMIADVWSGFGQKIDSPIGPDMLGYTEQIKIYEYDPKKANDLLQAAGWIDNNNDGIREKEGQNLEFSIVTISRPELAQTANLLKDFWQQIGAKLNVETKERIALTQENLRPRQYQILLFGELLNIDPDPFAFWHSSQKKDPGQNLCLYENAKVDALLQEARQDLDALSRAKKYQEFNQIISEDLPAIFLFAPDYLYPASSQIKGANFKIIVTPSERFSQIENWYIATKRTWKK
jgi:peptide/nickel transport system substrate-binding protein